MDKMTFASYKFKPSDVIEGLNRYFAETKAYRYRRVPLEIRNGEVKPGNYYVLRNIVFNVYVPKIKRLGYYYLVCDPEEVVGVAINWLREEHDIFYTPGMEVPKEDCDIFCEENLDVVPVARVREALGIAEDSDIFQCIKYRNSQLETLRTELVMARRMYRELVSINFRKAEGFRKEKQALTDSIAELRAKVREIYRSVVDDEWDESLSYTSALNDINEEYKRVVHNFEERTADWSKVRQEYDRYKLAVGSLLDIPEKARGDINAIERSFDYTKKVYESLKEFRDNVCEIFDVPSSITDKYILKEIHDITDRYDELEDFRADICGVLDIDGMLGTPKQNDKYILERVEKLKDKYKEQSGLRQQWHDRYESEHERANGVQKALDREREKCRVKDISLETAKKQYEKVCSNLETAECALNGMKSKVRELRDEKTKVITAIGQDVWDDCLK